MKKQITNIFINSALAEKTSDGSLNYSFRFETQPIPILNKAVLKVANLTHSGSGHGNDIIIFKINGVMIDYNRFISNDGGLPTIIATNFTTSRNYTEENEIPLIKQTINSISISVSNSLTNPNAGISNLFNFCISLKIEEEINE
jgi:hypothetical protein